MGRAAYTRLGVRALGSGAVRRGVSWAKLPQGIRGLVFLFLGTAWAFLVMPWRLSLNNYVLAGLSTAAGMVLLVAGTMADRRRPDNPTAMMMALAGVAIFSEVMVASWQPVLHTVGAVIAHLPTAVLVHVALTYPRGRFHSRSVRTLVVASYALLLGIPFLRTLFDGHSPMDRAANLLLIRRDDVLFDRIWTVGVVLEALLALAVIWCASRRASHARTPDRRALRSVAVGTVVYAALALTTELSVTETLRMVAQSALYLMIIGFCAAFMLILLGLTSGVEVVLEMSQKLNRTLDLRGMEELLAGGLSDPLLRLATWDEASHVWLNSSGEPFVPRLNPGYMDVRTTRFGQQVRAELWDTGFVDPTLVIAMLWLVAGDLAVRQGAMRERQRLRRDLHDGAQQNLAALALRLRLLEDSPELPEPERVRLVADTIVGLEQAQADLRRLARGEPPAILAVRGLRAAVADLASHSPIPISLHIDIEPPLGSAAAETAWYVIAEAVNNALVHGHADQIGVTLTDMDGSARVEVVDNGRGGAVLEPDGGLSGLAARLAALGGTLSLPAGPGTRVRADIPM